MPEPGNDHEPMYARIRRHLLEKIATGEYAPGDRLPSELELSRQFKTTRSTVVHGLQSLVSDGKITREAGRGTFVAHKPRQIIHDARHVSSFEAQVAEQGASVSFRLLGFTRTRALADIAAKLDQPEGAEIYRLHRIRSVDGVPTVEEIRYLPIAIGDRLTIDALSRLSMYDILEREIGRPVAHIKGLIQASDAREDTANELRIKVGSPVLVRDYVLSDKELRPLVCGTAVFRREIQIAYSVDN